jgi:exonuclease VII small subunit
MTMDETENVVNNFLNGKLKLGEEINSCQRAVRIALQLASELSNAQVLMDLAIAISTIDKAWKINQEEIEELQQVINCQGEAIYNPVSTKIYHAAKYLEGKE